MNPIIDVEVEGNPDEAPAVSSPESSCHASIASTDEEEDSISGEHGNEESIPSDDVGATSLPQKSWEEYEAEVDYNAKLMNVARDAIQSYNRKQAVASSNIMSDTSSANVLDLNVDEETAILDFVSKKILHPKEIRDIEEMSSVASGKRIDNYRETFSQEQVDAIIKSKTASLRQENKSTKAKGYPIVEEVGNTTDDEGDDTSSESEHSETEIVQPQKKLKVAVAPTTEGKGKSWVRKLPQEVDFQPKSKDNGTAASSAISSKSSDLEILEQSHQQVLESVPIETRREMCGGSKESFKSAVELYTSEPLKDDKYVGSPIIKSPEPVALSTRSKSTARSRARMYLISSGQAIKNKPKEGKK